MTIYTVEIDEFGTKQWYFDDRLHREDGPAVEFANGSKSYYLHGAEYPEAAWREKLNKHKAPKAPCENKMVEVDGVKYKLVKI